MCKWLTPSEDSKKLKFTPRQHTVSVATTYRLPELLQLHTKLKQLHQEHEEPFQLQQ